ncbi:ribosomal protein L7/L12 [Actinomadura sp. BRA 177]|uniref:ribosomal protein L7/L12 n=1 Tax=Actinomadura sp. BRA 177 TaxID=2745202 RepID=UPI0015960408|nr:ribosomal protein L7/L12 [Actinomadura sp. BRA 177]
MKNARYILPEARERVVELVAKEQYIPAIKLVREVTGLGLKEAKEYVDGMKGEIFAQRVPPEVQGKVRALLAEGKVKPAAALVRVETGLGKRGAKDYVDAVRQGLVHAPAHDGSGMLSDRVRAFKHAGDYESAVAIVCAETGMGRDEAARFVEALR